MKTLYYFSGIVIILIMSIFLLTGCSSVKQNALKVDEIYKNRDNAIKALTSDANEILKELKGLNEKERNSVIALLIISNAMSMYEFTQSTNDTALNNFHNNLFLFSPMASAMPSSKDALSACFDEIVGCIKALGDCEKQNQSNEIGKGKINCDLSPDVRISCGQEAYCMINFFMGIHGVIPDIINGKKPLSPEWPPKVPDH